MTFIGPPVGAIQTMGDKIAAKGTVSSFGVPVVPGIARPGLTDDELIAAADEIGYPVLVKPSAGGGGKGMRMVERPADLPAALISARRESAAAFGDDTLFLERFVLRPRHIEVQVLADTYGNVVHFGERECSLQRRHQKVIEEAPSPLLDSETRARIGAAACDTARSVDYAGAGTVEFIVSADRPEEFFFMEMNTRLQVEHPVTELVTGWDLVEWQVRIAAGEKLTTSQADIALQGHAIEARVYAEDPARGFLPTGGDVLVVVEPDAAGVRVDSGLSAGMVVGSDYDPTLAKVIAHGADRAAALRTLDRALADTAVLGVVTNIEFVRFLLGMYRDGGLIPRGPAGHNYSFVMIAAHSTPLIVGAYMRGIRDFDVATAYEGMRKNHFPGGLMGHGHYEYQSANLGGIEDYLRYGYVPLDGRPKGWIAESASATLEYAYDDWCLAQMARDLGKDDDYRMFLHRAENYRNLFDRESGFMRPRRRDGTWLSPFDPLSSKYWCETNAWQFTWFVPHDVEGLIGLMGGRETFNRRLNDIFERSAAANFVAPSAANLGYVDYSNQPSMEMAHLFNYAGAPWLTQKWVREVKERTFGGDTPDLGYRGDEDQGQAGALGVMMAIGLFQVRGGAELEPVYEITSPIFDRITIHLDPDYYPGRAFVIRARNNAPKNRYIQSAALNGRPLTRPWFDHRELVKGGALELVLGPEPNKHWGSRPKDAPLSMTSTSATQSPQR